MNVVLSEQPAVDFVPSAFDIAMEQKVNEDKAKDLVTRRAARLNRQARSRSQQWKKSYRQQTRRVRARAKGLWLDNENVEAAPFLDGSDESFRRIGEKDALSKEEIQKEIGLVEDELRARMGRYFSDNEVGDGDLDGSIGSIDEQIQECHSRLEELRKDLVLADLIERHGEETLLGFYSETEAPEQSQIDLHIERYQIALKGLVLGEDQIRARLEVLPLEISNQKSTVLTWLGSYGIATDDPFCRNPYMKIVKKQAKLRRLMDEKRDLEALLSVITTTDIENCAFRTIKWVRGRVKRRKATIRAGNNRRLSQKRLDALPQEELRMWRLAFRGLKRKMERERQKHARNIAYKRSQAQKTRLY